MKDKRQDKTIIIIKKKKQDEKRHNYEERRPKWDNTEREQTIRKDNGRI